MTEAEKPGMELRENPRQSNQGLNEECSKGVEIIASVCSSLLSAYYMPSTALNVFHVLATKILIRSHEVY